MLVVGGGTGNHTTLTGLRNEDCNLSAVVAMTDSGGSSGRPPRRDGALAAGGHPPVPDGPGGRYTPRAT